MSDHLTAAEIAELTRGTLSGVARQRLVTHLLRGCPRCSRLLAPFFSPSLAPAAPRPEHQPLALPARAAAGPGLPDSPALIPPGAEAADGDPYEQPVARASAGAVRRMRELDRGRRQTAAMPPTALAPRAAAPATAQTAAALLPSGQEQRGLLRIEMLLAASWEQRYIDAHEMVRLAELALFAAERLSPANLGRVVTADVRARAWVELANAHRVADALQDAEQAMARAVEWQRCGSGDPWLLARIADLMASLLAAQRRLSEAGDLLGKVHRFYRRNGEWHLAGRALISRGIFAGYNNDPRAALALLTEGLGHVDSHEDGQLVAQAVQAILWNLVECGRFRQARIHLWRSRPLLNRHGGKLQRLRLRWLEGRIHAGLGDLGRAGEDLAATRSGFEAAGSPYSAGLVSLDLATVWLREGKTQQVRQLVEEVITVFRALRIAREAVAALLILREACDRDAASLEHLRSITLLLAELERQPRRHTGESAGDRRGTGD